MFTLLNASMKYTNRICHINTSSPFLKKTYYTKGKQLTSIIISINSIISISIIVSSIIIISIISVSIIVSRKHEPGSTN